jgi:sulfite dehydrogenase (quinone) subunit SoeC
MHPAPSVILFTVLSGMGFGLLMLLGADIARPEGWPAFWHWGLGYALAAGGLLSSTFHLGNPQRALLAFTQWRTSWLSREAWASVAALLCLAPMALSDWLGFGLPRLIGLAGGVLCMATIISTAMIYMQMTTVPRWNTRVTPLLFLSFAYAGGALLAGQGMIARAALGILLCLLLYAFSSGDRRFAARAHTMATATGLGRIGEPSVFEQPHTGDNYLLREMIHVVARRHALKLRVIAVWCAAAIPLLLIILLPREPLAFAAAALFHLAGAVVARWLFFAEAEHVVGLYYGRR